MLFSKNEVIQLSSNKKYIIVDTTKYNDIYYYYICEIDKRKNKVLNSLKVITTVSEHDCLFVKTIKGDLERELISVFNKQLGIYQEKS